MTFGPSRIRSWRRVMRWCLLWTQSRSLSWWLQRQLSSNIGIRGNCIHRVALACLLLSWDRPCWVMGCGKRGRVLYSRHYGWEYVRFCGVGQLSAEIGGSMGISFFRVPECLTSTKFNLTGPLLLFKSKSNYNSKFKIDSKHCTIRHGHSFFLLFLATEISGTWDPSPKNQALGSLTYTEENEVEWLGSARLETGAPLPPHIRVGHLSRLAEENITHTKCYIGSSFIQRKKVSY